MSVIELKKQVKKVLEETNLRLMHIRADTGLSENTIKRFLETDDRVNYSTVIAFENWLKKHSKESDGDSAA